MQFDIQDRRKVYAILEREGIEIPRYAVLDRDSSDPKQHELVESEDHVEVNGVIFNKPFVVREVLNCAYLHIILLSSFLILSMWNQEKPVSAEDHK